MLKTLWQVERPGIATSLPHCCHTLHQRSTCTRCAAACPTGALVFDEGLKLDLGRCRECGTCAAACPTGALDARNPTDDQLLAGVYQASAARRPVVFACEAMHPDTFGGQAIAVPCLGRLDESILLAALALGAPAVYLLASETGDCLFDGARDVVERVVSRVEALLAGSRHAGAIRFVEEWPAEIPAPPPPAAGPSRRDFLRGVGRSAGRVGSEAVYRQIEGEPAPAAVRPSQSLPPRRELLLAAWARLGQPVPAGLDSTGLWAHVRVSASCNACGMCARFCPTGALRTVSGETGMSLVFTPAHCVDCGLCKDVCYLDAIEYGHAAEPGDLSEATKVMLYENRSRPPARSDHDDRLTAAIRQALNLF